LVFSPYYFDLKFVLILKFLLALLVTVYVLAMVGYLEIVSSTFAQMLNRITNVEFTTVSPTIANTMLAVRPSCLYVCPPFI
jgi:uncharacterized membrane protein